MPRSWPLSSKQTTEEPGTRQRGEQGVGVDGKAQRGRRVFERGGGVVHALMAFGAEQNVVPAGEPIRQAKDKADVSAPSVSRSSTRVGITC